MEEVKFSSENEALQYLADISNKKIIVAVNENIKYVYDLAKNKDLDLAADAITHFFYGNRDEDNPFFAGFYKLRIIDDKRMDSVIYRTASEYLLDVEHGLMRDIEDRNDEEILEIMQDLEKTLERVIANPQTASIKKAAEDMFKLTFKTDNAAFEEDKSIEVARILRDVATKIETGKTSGKIFDINGNSIGRFEL